MPPEGNRKSALPWLEYAQTDLSAAETLSDAGAEPHIICFHCQQAVEKAYKAVLAWRGDTDIPRVHDLELLALRIESLGGGEVPGMDVAQLTDYVITGRYPGTEPVFPHEIGPALAMAREVLAWVRKAVGLTE